MDICKYCHEASEDLIHPCKCTQGVHKECLEKWLERSISIECEICKGFITCDIQIKVKYNWSYIALCIIHIAATLCIIAAIIGKNTLFLSTPCDLMYVISSVMAIINNLHMLSSYIKVMSFPEEAELNITPFRVTVASIIGFLIQAIMIYIGIKDYGEWNAIGFGRIYFWIHMIVMCIVNSYNMAYDSIMVLKRRKIMFRNGFSITIGS